MILHWTCDMQQINRKLFYANNEGKRCCLYKFRRQYVLVGIKEHISHDLRRHRLRNMVAREPIQNAPPPPKKKKKKKIPEDIFK